MAGVTFHGQRYLSIAGVTCLWPVLPLYGVCSIQWYVPGWCHMHMAGVTCPWLELPVHGWGYLSMAGLTCPSMTNCTRHWW